MSEPITLTERERAVFESLAASCNRGLWSEMGCELREWLAATPAESASPPRVPVGITGPVLPVESGPGQPIKALDAIRAAMIAVERVGADPRLTDAVNFLHHAQMRLQHFQSGAYLEPLNVVISAAELTRLREQVQTERRAGIEAAAQWHEHEASTHYGQLDTRQADWHVFCAAAIRALADKPAPDALLPGLMEARKMMTKYAAREPIMDAWDALRDKLDLEIAARKGG